MKKKIYYSGIKLLIAAVCISVVTYAWFTKEDRSNVNDLDTYVEAVTKIDVSTDGGNTWNNDGLAEITDGLIFEHEVTGDGSILYVPALKDGLGTPSYFTEAEEGSDYVDVNIAFKSTANAIIFLEQASAAIPTAGLNENNLCCSSDVINQSADGNFSKDLIAGAVRIAFLENDENGEPTNNVRMVWAPNKNYEINLVDGSYIASLNSESSQDYRCLDIISTNNYTYKEVPNLYDTIKVNKKEKKSYGEPYLTTVNAENIASLTARIWIEGNDRETVAALKGGMFKLKLSFLALAKSLSETPNVSVSGGTIEGADNTMEYSVDNGSTWYDYQEALSFNSGDIVLIRVKETTQVIQSETVKLIF